LPAFTSWTKYPGQTPCALVAENKTACAVTEVGKKTTIVLKPGETLCFLVNDWSWDYANNSGSLQVSWSGVSSDFLDPIEAVIQK
jgi:D-lyxose ketol-isomerase